MKVSVRKRLTSVEKSTLYLDVILNGKRTKEALNLSIYNTPKNKTQQFENVKTLELAERLKAERLIEIQDKKHGIDRQDHSNKNFIDYFQEKTDDRYNSSGNHGNWNSAL